jgi:transcriptional regulator with XRE-family HTH domain
MLSAELDRLGWTQSELARRSGLPASVINRIITGERPNPTIKTTKAIESALQLATQGKHQSELDRFLLSDLARDMALSDDEVRALRALVWWMEGETPTLQAWGDFVRARRGLRRDT